MKFFTWEPGRQDTGYQRLRVIHWGFPNWLKKRALGIDLYVLRYPAGSYLPVHTDPVPGYRHFRFNVVMKQSKSGGKFLCDNTIFNTGRIKLFQSDLPHSLTPIESGVRYVLSFGICLK
jgi:hypothetical protein